MSEMIDKRDRAALFRQRLAEAMADRAVTRARLPRRVGVDRSTISQLLAPGTRLPNAQLAADCAQARHIGQGHPPAPRQSTRSRKDS